MMWHSFFFKNEAHDVRDRDYDWDEKLPVHLFYSIGHVLKIKNTYFLLYYIKKGKYIKINDQSMSVQKYLIMLALIWSTSLLNTIHRNSSRKVKILSASQVFGFDVLQFYHNSHSSIATGVHKCSALVVGWINKCLAGALVLSGCSV